MPVALLTNYLPAYRVPLYRLLAERLGVEVHCFGGEAHYVPESLRGLDRQIASAPFPAHRLRTQRDAYALAASSDAVIASTTGRVALPAAYLGARRAGRPFLYWASFWRHPRTPAHLLSLPFVRHLYRSSAAVLTYGPHVSAHVARVRGGEDGVYVAPQAVEPELFARRVGEEEVAAWRREVGVGEGPIVLFAGRLVEDKGVRVLLDAWRLAALRSETCAALCLAGDGPLAREAAALDDAGVRVLGGVERERLAVAYAASAALVVPSIPTRRFLEPWGLVCNEAMSQGRPVIASAAVGAAAGGLVRDGDTGIVVPAGDARALATALERLLRDEPLRHRLGERAREAVAGYTYERAADAFAAALEYSRAP